MNDLYEAMGTIAAAAHANGDTIDENIRPEDNFGIQHGFGIIHKSNYMRIGKQPEEQRFEITSPYSFLSVLKRNYNESELEARANVDLSTLPPEERDRVINSVLEDDLRKASNQYDEFVEAYSQEVAPTNTDLIRITYGDEDLWNGFFIRDYIYPFEESFSISEYRRVVSKVRSIRIQTTEMAHEVVDVLDAASSEELAEDPETEAQTDHQLSSPGFQ
jgi:hypothetical protein